MVEFIYEDCITDQEKAVLQAIESVANTNESVTVHDLAISIGVYSETRSLGMYFIGSGSSHIWIHRKLRGRFSGSKGVRIARVINSTASRSKLETVYVPEFDTFALDLSEEADKAGFNMADYFVMTKTAWDYLNAYVPSDRFNYYFKEFVFSVMENCIEGGGIEGMFGLDVPDSNKEITPEGFAVRHNKTGGKSICLVLLFSESLKLRDKMRSQEL